MEETAERMAALKKVYADIILNMGKESAARVLASDRRALCFQQSLAAAKEEALATLLRLKSIMDSKIREAETASLGQLRKIQELETQLREKEDTISSLRTELKEVNSKLAKIKNNIVEPLNGQNANGHVIASINECQERKPSSDPVPCSPAGYTSTSKINTNLNQRTAEGHHYSIEYAKQVESLKDSSAENECSSNPDLASIIMRSKEPELYRNGCTQRIRAFEQNLLTAKVPLGQSEDQLLELKSEIACENGKDERPCIVDSPVVDEVVIQVENSIESEEIVKRTNSFGNSQVDRFSRRALRKRRGRRSYRKSANCGTFPGHDMAYDELSDTASGKCSEDGNICPSISCRKGSAGPLPCSNITGAVPNVTKQSHSDSENQISQSSPYSAENIGCGNSVRNPSLTDMRDPLSGTARHDAGDTVQEQLSTLMASDQNTMEDSHNSLSKLNFETSDVPTTNSIVKDEKICEPCGTAQAGTTRFLKYTFQRKRKRASSNSKDENALLEKKNASKKRAGDSKNASLEPQKSIAMELPRNNRRLMQVARQLISLSERRW